MYGCIKDPFVTRKVFLYICEVFLWLIIVILKFGKNYQCILAKIRRPGRVYESRSLFTWANKHRNSSYDFFSDWIGLATRTLSVCAMFVMP